MPKARKDEAAPTDRVDLLRRIKAERLDELARWRPGQKHYKRALRAYLAADGSLQKVLMKRLGLSELH